MSAVFIAPFESIATDNLARGCEMMRRSAADRQETQYASTWGDLTETLRTLEQDLSRTDQRHVVLLDRAFLDLMKRAGLAYQGGNLHQITAQAGMVSLFKDAAKQVFGIEQQEIFTGQLYEMRLDWYQRQIKAACPDHKLFRDLQKFLCWTTTGEEAEAFIHAHKTPVLFMEKLPDDDITNLGTMSSWDGSIRIAKKRDITKNEMASTLVHEARHRQQLHNFPELFVMFSDPIDLYVALKLKERDAWCVAQCHDEELADFHYMALEEASKDAKSDGALSRDYLKRMDHRKVWREDLNQFMLNAPSDIPWASYERRFCGGPLLDVLATGNFREQVAASSFLQPDFLTRFCVDAKGHSYLPENPHEFFAKLVDEICTLHHPSLVRTERNALQQKLNGQICRHEP